MKDNEKKLTALERKAKIRERYKGVDLDEIDVILAAPEEDIYNPTGKKRIGVYARVSTDDPNQTSSYELQKNHYEDYVSSVPNWELVKIYADEGISGTSLSHREAFKEMIADCLAGKIDIIITKSVSRFARNTEDCLHYMRKLKSLTPPVGIKFETEGIFSLNSDAEMILSFMATLAQEESHNKSEIMNASIEMRFRRGIFLTPTLLGYEHDEDGNLIINEEEAKIVKLIFFMFLYGYNLKEIADSLTKMSCPTKKGASRWSPSTIREVLQNERHCGDVRARKTYTPNYLDHKSKKNNQNVNQYYQKNHHEAIISRADFNAVQKKLQNAKYATVTFLPSLHVIEEGILKGFIPIHPHWAGFSKDDYINASKSVCLDTPASDDIYSYEANDGDFDLRGFEVVRGQFLGMTNHLSIAFSNNKITFGINAIRKLNETLYVELLIHPSKHLLAVRPTVKSNKHALLWKSPSKVNPTPKPIPATSFLPAIYELLGWSFENRYKVSGVKKQNDSESFLLFNLSGAEIILPAEKEEKKVAFKGDWTNHFGEDYYLQKLKEDMDVTDSDWQSQIESVPYETDDLKDVTNFETIKAHIHELTKDLKQEVGNG